MTFDFYVELSRPARNTPAVFLSVWVDSASALWSSFLVIFQRNCNASVVARSVAPFEDAPSWFRRRSLRSRSE